MSAIVLALWLAVAGGASAQETTGTLTGKLTDAQGLALPGATVTVTGTQGERSFVTDADGIFRAPFLVPGVYDVRAEMQGFKAVEQKAIPVSLGQTTSISLKLEVGGITETVSVVGTSTIVNTSSTTTGAVLSSELLQTIPVGRRFTDTLYLAPGVSSGGSVGRANPSVSGGSGLDNLYVVDGVNVTNTGYGAVGSYSIIFGSLGTRHALRLHQGSPGQDRRLRGRVRPVDRRRGQRGDQERQQRPARIALRLQRRPQGMEAAWKTFQSANGTVNTLGTGRSDAGAEAGFPIFRNSLFFFGAINPAWEKRTFIAPDGFPLRSLGEVDRERQSLSYSSKATWQVAVGPPARRLGVRRPGQGRHGAAAHLVAARHRHLVVQRARVRRPQPDRSLRRRARPEPAARSQLQQRLQQDRRRRPSVDTWRVTDTTVVPNVITGGIGAYEKGNESKNYQYSAKAHLGGGRPPGQGRRPVRGRRVRAGQPAHWPDLHRAQRHADRDRRVGQHHRRSDLRPDLARDPRQLQLGAHHPRRITGRCSSRTRWKVNDRLTINPGIRYEQQTLKGTFDTLTTLDGEELSDFPLKNNWAPRIGVVYDVLGNGKSKLYGNYGRYYARIPNDLAARALSGDAGFTRGDYFDADLTQPIPNGIARRRA